MQYTDIIKYLNGQAGREEVAQIEAWINERRENAITFHRWKSVWESAGAIAPPAMPDVDQAWNRVLPKLNTEKEPISLYRRLSRIAAAVILLFSLSYFGWPYFRPAPQMLEVATLVGKTKQIELPDGTKVWLNDKSKITYPAQFAKKSRTVKLIGEAFFEVKRNEAVPFIIEGEGSQVRVLGTSFVVNTHPDSSATTVEVRSGRVALFSLEKGMDAALTLSAGEQGTFNKNTEKLQKDTIQDDNFLAWQNKQIDFNETAIKEVEQTLEDVFKTNIIIENPALYNCELTGRFEQVDIEEILKFFTYLFNAEVVKEGRNYRIVAGNGC